MKRSEKSAGATDANAGRKEVEQMRGTPNKELAHNLSVCRLILFIRRVTNLLRN